MIGSLSRRAGGAVVIALFILRSGRPKIASSKPDATLDDVDLLVNAGIYRDRNLGEPALAAMIQQDIGANPENPHADTHGTFSFDVSNGTCGVLTALQIVDGFLKSHAIDCALVVASDADPGRRNERAISLLTDRGGIVVRLDRRRLRSRTHSLG